MTTYDDDDDDDDDNDDDDDDDEDVFVVMRAWLPRGAFEGGSRAKRISDKSGNK